MTTSPSTTPQPQQCGTTHGQAILALARTMLDMIVRCHEAVLQDEQETLAVIRHGLKQVRAANSEINECFRSAAELEGDVKALLAFVVQTPEQPLIERSASAGLASRILAAEARDDRCEQTSEETIANWFFGLSQELNGVHPQAAQMLRLRLLGLDRRQIAERLQLPPRLARHLFHVISSGRVLGEVGEGAAT